ncbi:MAG: CPBP family intramembrane metalloprotease [Alloprevotella sp.]|nr:CPBP family intramembrane metalloprotease [Alloprevotella sp.]
MKKSVRAGVNIGALLLLFVLAQVVSSAVAFLLANTDRLAAGQPLDPVALELNPKWAGIAIFFGESLFVVFLWVLRLIRRRPVPMPCFPLPRYWVLAVCAMLCISCGVSLLLDPLALDDAGMMAMFDGMKGNLLCLLALTVVGPLAEEVFFREGIQRQLRLAGWPAPAAIFAAALLFALVHGNLLQGIPALLLGCVLGLLYEATGDVRLPGTAHVVNNSLAVGLLYFPEAEAFLDNSPAAFPLVVGAVAVLLGGALLYSWHKKVRNARQKITTA